jgi:hypothetical protein
MQDALLQGNVSSAILPFMVTEPVNSEDLGRSPMLEGAQAGDSGQRPTAILSF